MKLFTGINEKDLEESIKERIHEMEQPAYQFPKRFQKRDYIIVSVAAAICLFMLIWGYSL